MNNTQLGIMLRLYRSKLLEAIASAERQLPSECFHEERNFLGYKTSQCDALEDLYELASELKKDADCLINSEKVEGADKT